MPNKPLILVDGSSWFFRAFHALPPLTTSKGQPVGAIYGVVSMIRKMMKEYPEAPLWVIFDAKGKTFRHEWYTEYKAHRPPTPPDLSLQYEPLVALLKAMGLPVISVPGVEADDVIATIAHEKSLLGETVLISTSDKDMAQLVTEQVTLINTMTGQVFDRAFVEEKFGVPPELIIDYLALVGDASDNVPGVPGCGPKTAVKWLRQYGSLESLMAHCHEVPGKIGASLASSVSFLPLSKQLVILKKDVCLKAHLDEIHAEADKEKLRALLTEFEFKTLLKELGDEKGGDGRSMSAKASVLVQTKDAFYSLLENLKKSALVCVDTETTSLNPQEAMLVGIAFAYPETEDAFYIPLRHHDAVLELPVETMLAELKPLLESHEIKKVGQNLKYDAHIFRNEGIELQGIMYDTMLESYLLNSATRRHDLDSLALKYLDIQTISYEDVAGKGKKAVRFDEIPSEKAGAYAAEDAEVTLKLHAHLYPMLSKSLQTLLKEIEIPLLNVLVSMEQKGVLLDLNALSEHGIRLKKQLAVYEAEAISLAGQPFNLNSPKQLQEIFYEKLGLPILAKTPTGQPSTAEEILEALAIDYPLPAVILAYRSLSKLVSTYIDALPKCVNQKTGRVHTSYNQAVAATGRLSSSEPNLQNIPIRTEEGRLIRKAFIASTGHVLLALDYSQIELRIMAHLSQDEHLLKAFSDGLDIHAATAARVFNISEKEVSFEERRRAKAINFGLIYGMSAFGLAKQLGVERQEAQYYIDSYFEQYPGVLRYMDEIKMHAKRDGYVETLFGRRLYLPDITTQNMMRRKAAERMAINAPMQGTAADIIKRAMIAIYEWQKTEDGNGVSMIMQVHDELVFEVREEVVVSAKETIKHLMETTTILSVPLLVSVGVGKNWDEAH